MARDASCITLRPAIIDLYIAALDPAEFMEGLLKRLYACLPFGVVGNRHKYPEPSHPFGLRARRERPRGRTAECRDELAASHIPAKARDRDSRMTTLQLFSPFRFGEFFFELIDPLLQRRQARVEKPHVKKRHVLGGCIKGVAVAQP